MRTEIIAGAIAIAAVPIASAQRAPVDAEVWARDAHAGEYSVDEVLLRRADTRTDPLSWQLDTGYPLAAKRAHKAGEVTVEVHVGADDRVLGCRATCPAADLRLTAAACPLVTTRGKFRHALGRDGSPRDGMVALVVTFEFPSSEPVMLQTPPQLASPPLRRASPIGADALVVPAASTALYPFRKPVLLADISDDGTVSRCGVEASSGTDRGDIELCRRISAVRFDPELDASGRPVAEKGRLLFPKLRP